MRRGEKPDEHPAACHRYLAVALAVAVTLPIGGCATFFAGKSTFGDNALVSADLPPIATSTLNGDLQERRNHFRDNDFGYAAAYYKQAVDISRAMSRPISASPRPTTTCSASILPTGYTDSCSS